MHVIDWYQLLVWTTQLLSYRLHDISPLERDGTPQAVNEEGKYLIDLCKSTKYLVQEA
jgi:hypothetical protein